MAARNRPLSLQAIAVLQVLAERPRKWSYGLEIADATGLASGSLYPILIRMADRGLLEGHWLEPERAGRPPRHAYRITGEGRAVLNNALTRSQTSPTKEA